MSELPCDNHDVLNLDIFTKINVTLDAEMTLNDTVEYLCDFEEINEDCDSAIHEESCTYPDEPNAGINGLSVEQSIEVVSAYCWYLGYWGGEQDEGSDLAYLASV